MTNRLARSQSLYLRKHAENPIDWWTWCDEALETARRDNKPIFLSIGYSSCHWCTVMEGEAFSDGAIAEYMNANFLPIKVDREERPDIDSIYMQTLQMMTGQGGWPLNVFLTPDDLIPFYGGTYFPMEPKYGRPGFLQVLQALRNFYDNDTNKIQSVKSEIVYRLRQEIEIQPSEDLNIDLLNMGLDYSAGVLTVRNMGPNFPMIPYAEAALHGLRMDLPEGRYDAAEACAKRGVDLALGGIYDHVAGGFHRYTVDSTGTVPHFEKMLYDNGQIVEYLANLWSAGVREPSFDRAIAGTVEWLQREMTSPDGYFYAAQDADSFVTSNDVEPEEGAFYVWTYSELMQVLTEEELKAITEQFTVTEVGNFEGKNVLQRRLTGELNELLETALAKLFVVRYGAPPFVVRYGAPPAEVKTFPPARNNQEAKTLPWAGRIPSVTDPKMIVAWNSLMISGLARAAAVLRRSPYYDLAVRCATFILEHQWVDDRFHRLNYDGQPAVIAQSEDYALFIKALLDLEQASLCLMPAASPAWLAHAVRVQEEFDEFLWSVETGGYYNTDARGDLVIRERSYDDNAIPSANGVAIANLIRLSLRTEDLDYLDRAEQALQAFSSPMASKPQTCPSLFTALDWYLNHTLIRTSTEQLTELGQKHLPVTVLAIASELLNGAVGLVCQGLSCQEPAHSIEQLQQQILQSQVRGS